jgi:D-aminoacyl-tRNA deacylase
MINGKTMILLIASRKDIAGMNITKHLIKNYPFKETNESTKMNPIYSAQIHNKKVILKIINKETTKTQNLLKQFQSLDLVVFLSRHCSSSCKPTFSVHTPGNLHTADIGGLPKRVSISPGEAMKNALKALEYFRDGSELDFDVSYECTHHGPSLNIPAMFVELGSSKIQWHDSKAAEIVGHAAILAISKFKISNKNAVLGIGGPHYNHKFTNLALTSETIFGHIIPKYVIQHLDSDILFECVQKTLENVDCAILDWKGIKSSEKTHLLQILRDINLSYKKI